MISVTAFGQVANPTTSHETFLPIPDFPGYSVSDLGTVKGPRSTEMSPADNGTGYLQVILYRDGKPRRQYVHRLLLMAHVGLPPFEGAQAAHWNGRRADNRLENLRWATPRENAADKRRHAADRRAANTAPTLH